MSRLLLRPELTLTIPARVLEQLGWTKATELDLTLADGALVVRPVLAAPSPPEKEAEAAGRPPISGDNAARFVELRLRGGLTRSEAALGLGLTYETVAEWEGGRGAPDDEQLAAIEAAFADPEALRARGRALQSEFGG